VKYLLLGNGDIADQPMPEADCVIQFNLCDHRDLVAPETQRFIFISNSGEPAARTVDFLRANANHPAIAGAMIICARNPGFYRLKQCWLRLTFSKAWRHYRVSPAPGRLPKFETLTFPDAVRLERVMRHAGMPRTMMPSTGMIAWDWVHRRMHPGDHLSIAGFTWQGWEGHAWDIERRLML